MHKTGGGGWSAALRRLSRLERELTALQRMSGRLRLWMGFALLLTLLGLILKT